jgi:hypothetical protein
LKAVNIVTLVLLVVITGCNYSPEPNYYAGMVINKTVEEVPVSSMMVYPSGMVVPVTSGWSTEYYIQIGMNKYLVNEEIWEYLQPNRTATIEVQGNVIVGAIMD